MNKFNTIIQKTSEMLGIVEQMTSSAPINPQQVSSDLEKVMKSVNPTTKKALQAIADPLEKSTEENPEKDILKKFEEMDIDKLSNDEKESLVLSLIKKGLIKEPEKNQTQQISTTNTAESPTSYGV
jgi:hypothetical protein